MVQSLRSRYPPAHNHIFTLPQDMSVPSSSTVSLATTLHDDDDEDSRALRRLLLQKISTRIDGAFDEIDRANVWLRIVKGALRDLKTRTTA
ncbi:hypothetical protein AZE42_12732 [Rhizopogon vesiculosus]|uniref:Uncharacterized protein n=1 Tax=Rhizopogon vesiculosus TaxID=180088 RepID=A0A1J8PHQ0_9AGAM|nr:hypothetical protein AZE42_12732 [Rhizopogon vesiculosus]